MRANRLASPLVVALAVALGAFSACSSDDSTPAGTGGAAGGQDASAGAGGATAAGGTGGATAAGGAGGQTAGAGGQTGTGGAAGRDAAAVAEASAIDAAATMSLTSTALTQGGVFQDTNTCAGVNTSPPLTWTAGPSGTMSYAVDLTDMTNSAVHWVIYDIPATTTALPAALPGDTTLTTPVSAKQIHRAAFFGPGGAYRGPCPNGNVHDYRFQVNAIGTTTLGGVTGTSTSDDVKGLVQAASLAHGDLSGTSSARAAPVDASGQ